MLQGALKLIQEIVSLFLRPGLIIKEKGKWGFRGAAIRMLVVCGVFILFGSVSDWGFISGKHNPLHDPLLSLAYLISLLVLMFIYNMPAYFLSRLLGGTGDYAEQVWLTSIHTTAFLSVILLLPLILLPAIFLLFDLLSPWELAPLFVLYCLFGRAIVIRDLHALSNNRAALVVFLELAFYLVLVSPLLFIGPI